MYRIDNTSAVPNLEVPGPPGNPGFFTNGNPAAALEATIVDAWWMNQLQEEIIAVINAASIPLNKASHTQLLEALDALYVRSGALANYLPLSGGTLSNPGYLTISHPGSAGLSLVSPSGIDNFIAFSGTRDWLVGTKYQTGFWAGEFWIYDMTAGRVDLSIADTGHISLAVHPVQPMHAATKFYVDDAIQAVLAGTGYVPEAPFDNLTYGRRNVGWNPVLPMTGGTLHQPGAGDPLTIHADAGQWAGILYNVYGHRVWRAGAKQDGSFSIDDVTALASWFHIAGDGVITMPGVVQVLGALQIPTGQLWVGNSLVALATGGGELHGAWAALNDLTVSGALTAPGAYISGLYPGQSYGLIAQQPAQFHNNVVIAGNLNANASLFVNGMQLYNNTTGYLYLANAGFQAASHIVANGNLTAGGTLTVGGIQLYNDGTGYLRLANAGVATGGSVTAAGDLSAGNAVYAGGVYFQNSGGWFYTPNSLRTNGALAVASGATINGTGVGGDTMFLGASSANTAYINFGGWPTGRNQGNNWVVNEGTVTKLMVTPSGELRQVTSGAACYNGRNSPNWDVSSDLRLKDDVQPYRRGLADITKLRPTTYQLTDLARRRLGVEGFGLTAEEVAQIFPEAVGSHPYSDDPAVAATEEVLTLNISPILFAMINGFKELADRLDAVERTR